MSIQIINPATGDLIKTFTEFTQKMIEERLQSASQTYYQWKKIPFSIRKKLMLLVADNLQDNKEKYAKLITQEMGKPIIQSKSEIEKCILVCRYFAENAEKFLSNEIVQTEAMKSYIHCEPLGVILVIMPWNFPFWQVFRAVVPIIMAGNTVVLKHASNVSQTSLVIEKIFHDCGFLKGVFTSLLIEGSTVLRIIDDKRIVGVTLTGSESVGKIVAEYAGSTIKKTLLELGGSDPFIILSDANLESASEVAVQARMINAGQSCIAAKRFIVCEDIVDEFISLFVSKMKALVLGDPLDEKTQVGPLARKDLLTQLHQQVEKSLKKGAQLLLGGKIIQGKGFFYEQAIVSNVVKGMPLYDEEVFGPVASIIIVADENEALCVANDTKYGLGASVWTQKAKSIEKFIHGLEVGSVFINDMVKSDPRLPFGGIKLSGYGRELGMYGIKEFVNIKTIVIK
ncbi:MAG TPA: NAD-dependent succinate-semialdehyde dehydrogenase [Patescibacteria group bacterium]|nr:NAD-dependent succinate-semialdehyde dehydrogenase [Patescibacteria group bacterium]